MSARSRHSLLSLQMGQEVIYLIFTVSLLTAFVLAIYALNLRGRLDALMPEDVEVEEPPEPVAAPDWTALKPEPDPGIALMIEPDPAKDLPPILTLSEAEGYFFEFGSAALSDSFRERLTEEVVPKLVESADRFRVDVIEVIGHTDEVPMRTNASSLDRDLLAYLQGEGQADQLLTADNVGLGMARAAAVARLMITDGRLGAYQILPLSAGQAIELGERLATGESSTDTRERRRIEVRMRRRQ